MSPREMWIRGLVLGMPLLGGSTTFSGSSPDGKAPEHRKHKGMPGVEGTAQRTAPNMHTAPGSVLHRG